VSAPTAAVGSVSSLFHPTLDPAALYGLPGDVVRTLGPHTEADPVALLLHFLTMFGNVCGDGPHWPVQSTPHPGRLFTLIVGDPADARKGTAGDAIEDLMARAEPEWYSDRIQRGIQSAEALVRLVDDNRSDDRRLMVFEAEFGRLLATLAQRANLSATIKSAFDGKTLASTTKDEDRALRATRPHVSVVGHVQPGVLAERLPDIELTSGFANRFLYAVVARSQLLPDGGGAVDDAALDALASRICDAVDAAWEFALSTTDPISRRLFEHYGMQPRIEMGRSAVVVERWRELYGFGDSPGPLNQRLPGILGDICSRAYVHVMRLAVVYALADSSPIVELEHLEAAYATWRFCKASARAVFGSVTGDRNADRMLAAISAAPTHRLTRAEVSLLFHRGKTAKQLDAICEAVLATGLVQHDIDASGVGRPRHVYSLIEGTK
jgi:Protein of unknown function (DUF3987)